MAIETQNRPDEWKIEQGRHAATLPILDQSGPENKRIPPEGEFKKIKDEAKLASIGDPLKLFNEEQEGWKG